MIEVVNGSIGLSVTGFLPGGQRRVQPVEDPVVEARR